MHRRHFLQVAAGAVAGAAAAALPLGAPAAFQPLSAHVERLGVGLFTLPKMLAEDFAGTMAAIAEVGYREVEFFGPYPFSPEVSLQGFERMAQFLGLERHAY